MSGPRVAIAIPAYNEAEGLPGFLEEVDRALSPLVDELRLVVIDDASGDGTRGSCRSSRIGYPAR